MLSGLQVAIKEDMEMVGFDGMVETSTIAAKTTCCILELILEGKQRAPVAQWVVRPTRTRLVPKSKHNWCKNPLALAMIAS